MYNKYRFNISIYHAKILEIKGCCHTVYKVPHVEQLAFEVLHPDPSAHLHLLQPSNVVPSIIIIETNEITFFSFPFFSVPRVWKK